MKRAFKIGTTSNRKRAKVIAVRIYTSTLYMLLHSEERGILDSDGTLELHIVLPTWRGWGLDPL